MIRLSLNLFFLLFLPYAFAAKGIVVALDVPLFSVPNNKAPVIQYVRKGDLIYLHSSALEGDLIKKEPQDTKGFYKTLDNNGHDAYISKKFVNILLEGFIEIRQPRTLDENDPTDHRLAEPLEPHYPLLNPSSSDKI